MAIPWRRIAPRLRRGSSVEIGARRYGAPCEYEFGNHERLAALAVTVERPDVVDVKCEAETHCRGRDERKHPCEGLEYTPAMVRAARAPQLLLANEGHVAKENYTRHLRRAERPSMNRRR